MEDSDSNPFITLSFRGEIRFVRKDLIEFIPYLKALIESPCQNSAKDSSGYFIIDESANYFFNTIDKYRSWLEADRPNTLNDTWHNRSSKWIHISIAKRFGFDIDFIEALSSRETFDENDLFKCYYCKKTYVFGERETFKECNYHAEVCSCNKTYRLNSCARVPFHTPTPIKIAQNPRKKNINNV